MKLRIVSIAAACLAAIVLLAQTSFESTSYPAIASGGGADAASRTPAEYHRAPDNTFLTFPEWYLVYSPREYADFIADRSPAEFPYRGHIAQFWQGYKAIYDAAKDYPPNVQYHVMIWVIGVSTTAEYGLKWSYETLVGRPAEALRFGGPTAEDRLAADVAREYVEFLDREPWFNFDFLDPLRRLWTETGWWGADPIRKWERKYFLTSEYLAKAMYGWVLKKANTASYGVAAPTTVVVLDRLPEKLPDDVTVLEQFPDGAVLAQLPRYQAFTPAALALARSGVNFVEIAGNRGAILTTAIVPQQRELEDLDILFEQPIMTEPGRKRVALVTDVERLSDVLRRLDAAQLSVEHIYDY